MKHQNRHIVAKEGWIYVLVTLIFAIISTLLLGWWSLFFWLIFLFVLQFFRDPERIIPTVEGAVVSPADGRILLVETTVDPLNGGKVTKISVFMNIFNVHVNRSPVDGIVIQTKYTPGSFLNAAIDKASTDNEQNAVLIKQSNGLHVYCVQIAGLLARRIHCYAKEGDHLNRGQRYGFIRFGSRMDLYLPMGYRPTVAIGDKVMGGETIVALSNA